MHEMEPDIERGDIPAFRFLFKEITFLGILISSYYKYLKHNIRMEHIGCYFQILLTKHNYYGEEKINHG